MHYSHDAWEVVPPKAGRRDPEEGRRQARHGVELEQRGHQDAAGRGARRDRARAPALSLARRDSAPGPRIRRSFRSSRTCSPSASTSRSASSTSTAPTPTCPTCARSSSSPRSTACSCTRIPTPMPSCATSSRTRMPRCCGRIPASSGRRRCARCCASIPTSRATWRSSPRTPLNGKVAPGWREAFLEFPDRFVVGTDTFTPERWHYVVEHARWSRQWLADLPPDVAAQDRLRERRPPVRRSAR